MATLSVPITFQIFQGNQCVRAETLNESIIKIGKLASSHLRLEDETVSRMHAVIEVVGPGQVQLIDLGSTRGTTVNGERISHVALKPGDHIHFGEAQVIVAFPPAVAVADATPAPRVVVSQGTRIIPPSIAPTRPAVKVNTDGDVPDGSKAIEVQTVYRGVAIGTRYMTDATGRNTAWQTRAFMGAGLAFILMALATFFTTMTAAGHE